jgi:hypothetical protein
MKLQVTAMSKDRITKRRPVAPNRPDEQWASKFRPGGLQHPEPVVGGPQRAARLQRVPQPVLL